MTGAQEQAYGRLRKSKTKSNVKVLGTIGGEVQVQWVEKDVFGEDQTIVAFISQNGLMRHAQ